MYSRMYRFLRSFYPGGKLKNQRLKELDRLQWYSADAIDEWRFARLRQLVRYAYEHVPFYRQRYQDLGIHPADMRSLQDFQQLPILTRADLKTHREEMVSPQYRAIAVADSTGGSTGMPVQFYMERAFSWWDNALELRGRGWYGVEEGDKVAWVWGAARDMRNWNWKKRLSARILRERYLNAFDMSDENMEDYARMLVRWQPRMIRAYASSLTLFAQFLQRCGIRGIRPRLIETTAEKVSDAQRDLLQETFQCPVVDWYTAREFGTIAFQCPQGGLHVVEPLLLEVLTDGQPAAPGQLGEVILTSTHQFAMPLIRYQLGDLAIYDPDTCPCGRGMPVLKEVVGRTQDYLVNTRGLFVHGGYFSYTFRQWPEIFRYQVYQPDSKHLEIRLICQEEVNAAWLAAVRREVQRCFGEDMQIHILLVDQLELTPAGKHRIIISKVKPDFVI